MADQISYVTCYGLSGRALETKKIKFELMRGNDEPCEMILDWHRAQDLLNDLKQSLEAVGIIQP